MQPLYFNPLDSTGNFIGTNPLRTTGVPIKTTLYPYFNPSIYQSFTFYSFPIQSFYASSLLGTAGPVNYHTDYGNLHSEVTGGTVIDGGDIAYSTMKYYSINKIISTQFSTFETFYASYFQLQPVTYSVRFGTETQPIIASTDGAVDTYNTYLYQETQKVEYYSYIVATWVTALGSWVWESSNRISGLTVFTSQLGIGDTIIFSSSQPVSPGTFFVGSSSFVNIMGSNVYTGLIDTTNSIIIYQNEQVSSYYSQSLSYQVNIANLTAALNSVSGTGKAAEGKGTITVTYFSWAWETTAQGWTGSQLTDFTGYTYQQEVNIYLSVTYGGTVITNSSVAVTQVQSLITVQNNDLANAQTFMNNAVTTLQSQVSLAGQIIGTLSSIMQSIINNI